MVNINKLRKMEKARISDQPVEAVKRKAAALPPEQESAPLESTQVRAMPEPPNTAAPISAAKSLISKVMTDKSASAAQGLPQQSKANEAIESTSVEEKIPPVTAAPDAAESRVAEIKELITFRLDSRLFGIFVDNVHSVVKPSHITRVPQVEDYLVGIMNLRGIITPIYDLKRRFSIGSSLINDKTRILIIEYGDSLVGFLVDEIATLHDINLHDIQPAPEIAAGVNQRYIRGVVALPEQDELIIIIALEEIIRSKERSRISH